MHGFAFVTDIVYVEFEIIKKGKLNRNEFLQLEVRGINSDNLRYPGNVLGGS